MAQLLSYTRTSTIDAYVRDRPGYFPEPDEDIDGPRWRRGTIVAWVASRPGKGRRSSAPAAKRPEVSADGDPDELLGTPEVAALLGYASPVPSPAPSTRGASPNCPHRTRR
ncbi:hypothetical protein [Streptomyces sp. NPDC002779]|uniref:hypothetical protein n=1 Tax=Streptomyces sp. NPDC002779 TaxID=3364664 RepID=UPI00368D5362